MLTWSQAFKEYMFSADEKLDTRLDSGILQVKKEKKYGPGLMKFTIYLEKQTQTPQVNIY